MDMSSKKDVGKHERKTPTPCRTKGQRRGTQTCTGPATHKKEQYQSINDNEASNTMALHQIAHVCEQVFWTKCLHNMLGLESYSLAYLMAFLRLTRSDCFGNRASMLA